MTSKKRDAVEEASPVEEPVTPVVLLEDEEFERSLQELMAGKRISFDALGQKFYIRQPTDIERDESTIIQMAARQKVKARPQIAELTRLPLPQPDLDEIETEMAEINRRLEVEEDAHRKRWWNERLAALEERKKSNAADTVIESAVGLARNRWLAPLLLEYEDGRPVVDKNTPWASLHPQLQDSATLATQRMMRYLYLVPFDSVRARVTS